MATLTGYLQDNEGTFIEKDTAAVLDYTMDWGQWLPTGEVITASTWTVETITGDTSPLALTTTSFTSTRAIIKLQNGTAGKIYKIYNTITTTTGLRDRRYFRIKVKTRTL
jgi:hypothetical protein